ncbi:MAG TPA: DNA recombination protein RmuC, partial [Chromatiaceae bacterium]|nr:DNA recombination protein RmuC [Chromatiaceae bacterium]
MHNVQAFWAQYSQEILFTGIGLVLAMLLWLLRVLLIQRTRLHSLSVEVEEMAAGLLSALNEHRQEIADGFIKGQLLTRDAMHSNINELQETLGQRQVMLQRQLTFDASSMKESLLERFVQLQRDVGEQLARQRESFEKRQTEALDNQHKALQVGMEHMSGQLRQSQAESTKSMNERLEKLAQTTDERLQQISGQVEKRLTQGFEKTTEVFSRVLEHLSRIDEAQKKITELSGNVVSLQEVLTDKRSRGAFGEVQLEGLVRNVMPEGSYAMQQTLSNDTRVDCLLTLPEPTGRVPID